MAAPSGETLEKPEERTGEGDARDFAMKTTVHFQVLGATIDALILYRPLVLDANAREVS